LATDGHWGWEVVLVERAAGRKRELAFRRRPGEAGD
jgi:hypothetical protein